jgi:hypothetical protein
MLTIRHEPIIADWRESKRQRCLPVTRIPRSGWKASALRGRETLGSSHRSLASVTAGSGIMKPRSIALALAFCVSLASTPLVFASPADEGGVGADYGKVVKQLRLTPMQRRRVFPVLRAEGLKIQGIKNNQSLSQSQKLRRLRAVQNRSNRHLRVILTRSQFQQLQANRQQRAQLMQAALEAQRNRGRAARSAVPPPQQ